ncbi:MAG TPA: response regulator [Sulfurimonas sp.]|nr:response regulator [Sulfurimonas sp.]
MSLKSIFFSKSSQIEVIQKERDTYKNELEKASKELEELKVIVAENIKRSKSTSFLSENMKKLEDLEYELKIQKQRVQEAKKIAQDAMHVKKDFLANMRHEVRTPMNSILAFSDMLTHELKDKTQLSHAKNIFSSGHKLLALMDDIIELSRLESGIFEVKKRAIDTALFFNSVVKGHKPKAYRKGLQLTLKVDSTIPESLIFDDEKVKEILDNLIGNAIKFTKNGKVTVNILAKQHNHTQNEIDISMVVKDTGTGIDAHSHQRIFEIFEKREDAKDGEFQGIGLGLSINKKMAKLMDGNISLSSTLGEGSTFTFSLNRLEIVLASADDTEEQSNLNFNLIKPEGASIMVIDDVQSSCEMIKNAFTQTNTKVITHSNLHEAIKSLKSHVFDLIFIDVNILNMDENAVSKVIAKMSNAPIVSLTQTSVKDIIFTKDGVNVVGHLKKPISKVELFKISLKVLNSSLSLDSSLEDESQTISDFSHLDKKSLEQFLSHHSKDVTPLFTQAVATNDLNMIASFSKTLFSLAQQYKISSLVAFSQELLQKIELFEIDTINTMMAEYKEKIKRLQNL